MKHESSILELISSLKHKEIEATAVADIFPDTIAKVVNGNSVRYHSATLNKCCDKVEFNSYAINNSANCINTDAIPYTEMFFEVDNVNRPVRIYCEPYRVEVYNENKHYKSSSKFHFHDYETQLLNFGFTKNIIRMIDLDIVNFIVKYNWDITDSNLNERVRTFLNFA